MSRDRHLVLIGPHAALCERARRAGVGVIVVDTPGRLTPEVIALADHVIATDYTDVTRTAELIAALGRDLDIVGALSLTEFGLIPVARISELLGLPDNPVEVVKRVRDKDLMRRRLAGDDRFSVPAALVSDRNELDRFLAEHPAPVVVKPHDGAGSMGVRLIDDGRIPDGLAYPLLAETYLDGREYSVEALSVGGAHTIIGITEKVLFDDSFVEQGHHFPAPLSDVDRALVHTYVRDFLDRIGLRDGLSHTEVILTREGPRAVETHTRNGGDHITDLVQMATGFDMLDAAVRIRAGLTAEVPAVPEPARAAVIRYFAPPAGTVREAYGAAAARYLPGVADLQLTVRPGDEVRPPRSSLDRVGYVMAVGADLDEARGHAETAMEAVVLTVE
ncbi:ATP-grasp domain-containing protein [Streptomyces sp. ISL-100]|uniref:ATP-grasp domain-containing protein n=1 Tax=Streptomyces sp. ISL-100 TaxID=2819173 RepID=UPI001BEAA71F|nr:ATP-grasp domain-containing protein [Streptomyces sp. ISL-100]MBT2395740.1 ATP-grasp domain-containing protein [Streptomyces sp. ISL-100]